MELFSYEWEPNRIGTRTRADFVWLWKTYGTKVPCRDRDDLGFRLNPCRHRAVPCAVFFFSHSYEICSLTCTIMTLCMLVNDGNTRNIALQLATQQSEQCCATSCTILLLVLPHLYLTYWSQDSIWYDWQNDNTIGPFRQNFNAIGSFLLIFNLMSY